MGSSIFSNAPSASVGPCEPVSSRASAQRHNWTTIDRVPQAEARVVVAGPPPVVYVVGTQDLERGSSRWIVRESRDGGTTFETIEDFDYGGVGRSVPAAAARALEFANTYECY